MKRPELSIRTRITVVFAVLFVVFSTITVIAVFFLSAFQAKIQFLENAASYSFHIEEARRNEKNFFLYGTGLPEALASATLARRQLDRSADEIRDVVGSLKYDEMVSSVDRYRALLDDLVPLQDEAAALQSGTASGGATLRSVEVQLRAEGAQVLSDAESMIDQERAAVSAMLHTSMMAAVGFLGVTLLLMVVFGGYVVRTVVRPLDRFLEYVSRVGAGNFEVIQPIRPYRDEFSSLALAFNRMLGEIVTHQDQLVQSGKMAAVGTLTSGIAHELNNPLNNIGLTIEALLDDLDSYPPAEQRRMLDQAYTQVERASTTVRNLLDFTRKDRSAFTRVTVKSVVDTALRLVGNEAMIAGVECDTRVDPDVAVRGNPHDLQQVLVNLLLNAIQAMPEGGTIRVEAEVEADEERVRIVVADTGEGIEPEHVDEIFDPFFTTKEPGRGTGLGLSVSHSIIEQHGGRITVASAPGEGTTFTIRLPTATTNDTDSGMK